MKQVTILRGVSGAGKSTYTNNNLKSTDCAIVSADHYFMKKDVDTGEDIYDFDISQISLAHNSCMTKFIDAIAVATEHIIVDNTNIQHWQYENYYAIAKMHGYDIEIVEFHIKTIKALKKCIKRNQHQVPAEVIAKMVLDFEPAQNAIVIEVE